MCHHLFFLQSIQFLQQSCTKNTETCCCLAMNLDAQHCRKPSCYKIVLWPNWRTIKTHEAVVFSTHDLVTTCWFSYAMWFCLCAYGEFLIRSQILNFLAEFITSVYSYVRSSQQESLRMCGGRVCALRAQLPNNTRKKHAATFKASIVNL